MPGSILSLHLAISARATRIPSLRLRQRTRHTHPEPAPRRQCTLRLQLEHYAASPVRRLLVLVTVLLRFWRVSLVLFSNTTFLF